MLGRVPVTAVGTQGRPAGHHGGGGARVVGTCTMGARAEGSVTGGLADGARAEGTATGSRADVARIEGKATGSRADGVRAERQRAESSRIARAVGLARSEIPDKARPGAIDRRPSYAAAPLGWRCSGH